MAAPTTNIHICNLALGRLGNGPISSLTTPQTVTEDRCVLYYDQTRRAALRSYIPNFAKKFVTLTAATDFTIAHGFETAYRLPNDHLRLLALGDISLTNGDLPAQLYELTEGHIATDYGDDDGLHIAYIFDAKDISKYDPLFVEVLWRKLALDMGPAFKVSRSTLLDLGGELDRALQLAASICGQEKPPRRKQRSRFRDVRRAGGLPRDNTRYP